VGALKLTVVAGIYNNGVLHQSSLIHVVEQLHHVVVLVLDGVEITIDTWPWIPTFMEIEGPSEEKVWSMAKALGYGKEQAKYGSVDTTYQHYYGIDTDVINQHTPEITFEMTPPEWVQAKSDL
jgi:hypothetical protein